MNRLSTLSRPTMVALAGVTLVTALAGCAATEVAAPTTTPSEAAETATPEATTTEESTTAEVSTSTYADGTYTETGSYQSPNGTESVDVTITLDNGIITAVAVVGHADNPNSSQYQNQFIGGISAVVVGQDIDGLSVSNVAGSSLTSGGFNAAVEAIKVDAAA